MSVALHCEAILFDLDGVLVDSHEVVERTWRRWVKRHQLEVPDIVRRAHGRRSVETVREIAPHLNAEDEVRWLADSELADFDGVVALPGAESILGTLQNSEWAVVTSGGRELARRRLTHAKLPVPEVLIAADDVTSGKPAPDGYLLAAAWLGRDPAQCLVIEDTPPGLQAGRQAGARTVALTTTFCRTALAGAEAIAENLSGLALRRGVSGLIVEVS
jgi:sugar-phosphatase